MSSQRGERNRSQKPSGPPKRVFETLNSVKVATPLTDLEDLSVGTESEQACLVVNTLGAMPVKDCRTTVIDAFNALNDARANLETYRKAYQQLDEDDNGDPKLLDDVIKGCEEKVTASKKYMAAAFLGRAKVQIVGIGTDTEVVLSNPSKEQKDISLNLYTWTWPEATVTKGSVEFFPQAKRSKSDGRVRFEHDYRRGVTTFVVISGPQHKLSTALIIREPTEKILQATIDILADGSFNVRKTMPDGSIVGSLQPEAEVVEGQMTDQLREIKARLESANEEPRPKAMNPRRSSPARRKLFLGQKMEASEQAVAPPPAATNRKTNHQKRSLT